MSRRGRTGAIAALVAAALAMLGLLLASPLAAQEGGRTEAELLERLERMVPELHRAQDEAERVRTERRAAELARRAPMDTLTVGPATVVVREGEAESARTTLGPVWAEEYAAWGPSAPPSGRTAWIAFQWSADEARFQVPDRTLIRVQGAAWRSRAYMEEGARVAFGSVLRSTLRGTRLALWLDGMPVRAPERPASLYRRTAVAASAPVRACLDGEVEACGTALSLELDDTPFDEWYTPEQRRLLVRRNQELWTRFPEDREVMLACLDDDLAACDRALALFRERQLGGPEVAGSQPYWGAPLPNWVRASFLWDAVSRGGPGTWDRLVEAAEMEPGAALEHATGMNRSELLAGWQAWLLEQRPRRENTAGRDSLPALLWAGFFLLLATRSTRWRLG